MEKKAKEPTSALARVDKQLLFGNLWLYIVSLAKRGKIHAYTLPEEIDSSFGFKPSRIMCYIVLYRLKAEGLIESREEGRRVYYTASPLGRSQLSQAKMRILKIAKKL